MANYFDQIQDYLDGALTAEDQQIFEQQLKLDQPLQKEVDLQRELQGVLKKHRQAEDALSALEPTLKQMGAQHFDVPRAKKRGIIRYLIPLAAAACLLAVFNYMEFFVPHFENLPEMPTSVTRAGGVDTVYQQAAMAFNAGEYSRSIDLLNPMIQEDSTVVRYRFYRGLSYLGQAKYQRALTDLKSVAEGTSVFVDGACYFAAVALWKLDNKNAAQAYAIRVREGSTHHQKAVKLQKRLH
ncbi:hypothetical protein [Parapedobacter sp. 10938]|uniref:hypothetical protein n=1 Tax=Parapedobacter flavus TaxID=3110225 RepID=UPI002DBED1A2|nr:hypothetical protein [Parapedobacter sp. 10938]MEC3879620.1 hypothetical protein [Parapedobacter sp. 10938]